MRIPLKDLPKSLFPATKTIAGSTFKLQKVTEGGQTSFVKKYSPWRSSYRVKNHLQVNKKDMYLEYVLQGEISYSRLSELARVIWAEQIDVTYCNINPTYQGTNVTDIAKLYEATSVKMIHGWTNLWIKIPLNEKQTEAVLKWEKDERIRRNEAKRKERERLAKIKADREAERLRAEEARKLTNAKVGKAKVTDVAEALLVLKEAGLKVVTVEESK